MNEEKKAKNLQEMSEWVELRDSWTRKRFDYQERWHGWRSPFGLGLGFVLLSAGLFLLSLAWATACAAHYLGDATSADAPQVSPLFADLRALPPTLIQAGTDELLHDQAVALHDALAAAGVDVECDITERRWHVFQMHGGALPSADDAIARLADFAGRAVDRSVAAAGTGPPMRTAMSTLSSARSTNRSEKDRCGRSWA